MAESEIRGKLCRTPDARLLRYVEGATDHQMLSRNDTAAFPGGHEQLWSD